jgi:hypothetical protein
MAIRERVNGDATWKGTMNFRHTGLGLIATLSISGGVVRGQAAKALRVDFAGMMQPYSEASARETVGNGYSDSKVKKDMSTSDTETLPDAPSATGSYLQQQGTRQSRSALRAKQAQEREASIHMKYIPSGWSVKKLRTRDKVELSVLDLVNPLTIFTDVVSAGYSHVANGQPNYGTNSGAFGQRVGATLLRDSSQELFSDAVFAPLLHQDPRYYILGRKHSLVSRTVYAVTRPFVTKADDGRTTFNSSLMLGYASAAGLTAAYYPSSNRNFRDVASTFGGSIGGAAFGYFVDEFYNDVRENFLHLLPKRK